MDNFMKRVSAIQAELKAPKGQYNNFGKYKYRSCEDILEAVKPLLAKHSVVLTIQDEICFLGEWHYIRATAILHDTESEQTLSNVAFAREEETKKGMDGSQITGTASSYARKYALNGLFCIDDTKDADTDEHANIQNNAPKQVDYRKMLIARLSELGIDATEYAQKHNLSNKTTQDEFKDLLTDLG